MKATDVELLIGSAYGGLEPSSSVEESVRAGLVDDRARPVRLGRALLLLALAAVLLYGIALVVGHRPAARLADGGDAPDLPVVTRPPSGAIPESGDFLRIRLMRDGRILVPAKGEGWRRVTLAEFGEHLARAAKAFDEVEAAGGRSGYDDLGMGYKASRLRIDLVADRDAPWRHVQWIMVICAEQRVSRLAFGVRSADAYLLDATLPADAAWSEPYVKVGVRVTAGERTRYAFGDQESEELASVTRYLASAREAGEAKGAHMRGEIKAGAATPFHEVAKLLAEFRQAGYAHVDFYGTAIPGDDVRRAATLPAPEHDWPQAGDRTRDR